MPPIITVLVVLAIVVFIIIISSIKIVRQSTAIVVERLGKFHRLYTTGVHFIFPFIDKLVGGPISLKERVADFAPQPVITKDNVTMQIDTVVYYQVTDAKLFTYGVEDPIRAIENLTATTLRNLVGELELLAERDVKRSIVKTLFGGVVTFFKFPVVKGILVVILILIACAYIMSLMKNKPQRRRRRNRRKSYRKF